MLDLVSLRLSDLRRVVGLLVLRFLLIAADLAEVVKQAIVNGYRLIDTAAIYGNETGTGKGIKQGLQETGLSREELFVTSKLWNDHLTYDEMIHAFNESLARLNLEYLDLYLIHWPGNQAFQESWRALEDLYAAGKIKAIGVSNFQIHHLEQLLAVAKVVPVVNQIELHPKLTQHDLRNFCAEKGIAIQAWSPLMQGKLLKDDTVLAIADAQQKSAAQVLLRWAIQQGILVNVKSTHPERMIANAAIFDFHLSEEEMGRLNALNEDLRVGPDPDTFDFH